MSARSFTIISSGLTKATKWIVSANRAVCDRIEERLPASFTRSLLQAHALAVVDEVMKRPTSCRVLDIAGGHNSPFVRLLPAGKRPTIISLDISKDQISANEALDLGIVADACAGLPLRDGSVDIAVTRSALEHLPDPRNTIFEIARVLRSKGTCLHVFPARHSPFAILNRYIPPQLGRFLLFGLFPEWERTCGFPAFYQDCDARSMSRLHEVAGLKIRSCDVRYYQSIYFKFFLPFYVLTLLYDYLMYVMNRPYFACQIFIVAEKP